MNYLNKTKIGKLSLEMINNDKLSHHLMNDIFKAVSTLKSATGLKSSMNEIINNINLARLDMNNENYRADYMGFFNACHKAPKNALLLIGLKEFKTAPMRTKYSSGKCIAETLGDTKINFENHVAKKAPKNDTKNDTKKAPKNDSKSVSDLIKTKADLVKSKKELSDFKKGVKASDKSKDKIIADIAKEKQDFTKEVKSIKSLSAVDLKSKFEAEIKRVSSLKITPEILAKLSAIA